MGETCKLQSTKTFQQAQLERKTSNAIASLLATKTSGSAHATLGVTL
jgi:hypothetical protein